MDKQIVEKCNVCQQRRVVEISSFSALSRVTSDCQVWRKNGRAGICLGCGTIQSIIDRKFLSEIEQIYQEYSVYHQGGGVEQTVRDNDTAQLLPRSELLINKYSQLIRLPEKGRLLDIGCSNGALLSVFSKKAPSGWSLSGVEVNEKYTEKLKSIDRFEKLYVGDIDSVTGAFDLISMVHVLEHIVDAGNYIKTLRDKLQPNGYLLVDVPDFNQNPFDLLIADHCTHFTLQTLSMFFQRNGFEIVSAVSDWVPKELTVIARKAEKSVEVYPTEKEIEETLTALSDNIEWLNRIIEEAAQLANTRDFGIFGTGIAATWLVNELGPKVSFFVDEDPARAGTFYMGKPVYQPQSVPDGGLVYIALPIMIAEKIQARLQQSDNHIDYYLPLQNEV